MFTRDHRKFVVGVHHSRFADSLEQWQVLGCIGIEIAVGQVKVMILAEAAYRSQLAFTPDSRPDDIAGEYALLDLEALTQHVLDGQVLSHRVDLVGGCRGHDGHRVSLVQVCLYQRPGLREYCGRQVLVEYLFAEVDHHLLSGATQHL